MAFGDITTGTTTGATIGGTLGSIVPGIGTAIGTAAGGLLGGGIGGLFGRNENKETKIQKNQRELVDQLLSSLNGSGPYSNLFTPNEADFQRSYVEPAKNMFKNQIAPQIQQSYIASGQQRGTGLEDQLARTGIDLDQLLNQQYMDYLQGARNRQSSAIGNILGQGPGAPSQQSLGGAALQGVGGYLSGDAFGKDISDILNAFNESKYNRSNSLTDTFEAPRKGYENENPIYNPYTGIQSYGGGVTMSTPSPFEIGRSVGGNITGGIRSSREDASLEDILRQSRESQNIQEQEDIMAQVLRRLPPEKRPEVMQFLQQKQQRLQQANMVDPKQIASQNALNLVGRAREIAQTGHLGPKFGVLGTGRKFMSTFSAEGQKLRSEYKQLGKALVQAAAPLKITNKAEFLHYAEDLEDPTKNLEDIEGSLNALERIIKNSLGQQNNQQSMGSSLPNNNQISEGNTATGPNGQKIVFRGGQWQPI